MALLPGILPSASDPLLSAPYTKAAQLKWRYHNNNIATFDFPRLSESVSSFDTSSGGHSDRSSLCPQGAMQRPKIAQSNQPKMCEQFRVAPRFLLNQQWRTQEARPTPLE
jgi:hypothetical protein